MILLVLDLIQMLGLTDCFPELASRVFGLGCSHQQLYELRVMEKGDSIKQPPLCGTICRTNFEMYSQ